MVMFALIRSEKLKKKNIGAACAHNNRDIVVPNARVAVQNETLIACPDYEAKVDEMLATYAPKAQKRTTSVLAQELILSASAEYFRPTCPQTWGYWEDDKYQNWKTATFDFLKDRYGKNLIACEVHLDESTPHMHAVVIPLTKVTEKNPHIRLSAFDVFTEEECVAYHTAYAEATAHLGLVRGVEGSKAKHQAVKKFYADINSPLPNSPVIPSPPVLLTKKGQVEWADKQNEILAETVAMLHAQATQAKFWKGRAEEEKLARQEMVSNYNVAKKSNDDLKKQTDALRDIPMTSILEADGWVKNKIKSFDGESQYDKDDMRLTVTEAKNAWYNHSNSKGGYGAIDLVMHLNDCSFANAKAFLVNQYGKECTLGAVYTKEKKDIKKEKGIDFAPPLQVPEKWNEVINFLLEKRMLSDKTIENLISNNRLYPDIHGNCCFVYGNTKKPAGVEKRGTGIVKPGEKPFKGFAGKKASFWVENSDIKGKKKWAICESAIEAASYIELYPDRVAWSISGSANKDLITTIIKNAKEKDIEIIIATNNDEPGRKASINLKNDCLEAGIDAAIELPWGDNGDWNSNLIAIKKELKDAVREITSENIINNHALHIESYKCYLDKKTANKQETTYKSMGIEMR